jgi:tetratricopeptide (TPR) repeat protein
MNKQAPDQSYDPFVNRECELAELRAGLQDALAGRGRFCLIAGDPGIGKTRLADELCNEATERGVQVLWGRCWEGGSAPAFWPWTQVMRSYVRQCAPEALTRQLGAGAAELTQFVPEIGDLASAASQPTRSDAHDARFRLFDGVATFLRTASQARPLLLAFDDLHAADPPTLRLLQFVARDLRGAHLFLLGMYRSAEVRHGVMLREIFGELGREGRVITLRGLSGPDLARFVEARLHHVPDPALVDALHRATSGNPFFVDAVVRGLLAERPAGTKPQEALANLRIPDHVREVIRQHLRPLPEATLNMLSVAAVIGHEFELSVLQQVVLAIPASDPVGREHLLDLLGNAVAAGLITEATSTPGHFRFVHALIRETLYGDLTPARRSRVHRSVGEALQHLNGGCEESRLPELAHHFFAAVPGGDVDKAVNYQVAAGELAMRHLAYELATQHFERALQAYTAHDPPNRQRECEILLALGAAQMRGTDATAARQTFLRAAALARQLQASGALACAALGVADIGMGLPSCEDDGTKIDLFEETLAALDGADSALRVRVLGRLAVERYYRAPADERAALADASVAMARRLGDPAILAHALCDRHAATWQPENLKERLATATEAAAVAEQVGDDELRLRASMWLILDLLENADGAAVDRQIEECARRAGRLRQPRHLWLATHFRAVRAQSRGEFAAAERLAQEALEFGERAKDPAASTVFTNLVYAIRVAQGRLGEFEPAMRAHLERYPDRLGVHCGFAYICAELGRTAEARSEFELVAMDDFARLPQDHGWLCAIAYLAQVCAFLGDTARAPTLYAMLARYEQRTVMLGHPNTFVDLPVAHYRGVLAALLGRHDVARAHFEASLALATRLGAHPAVAWTQYEYARLLLANPGATAHACDNARQLLDAAFTTARALGMQRLAEKTRTLLDAVGDQTIDATDDESPTDTRDGQASVQAIPAAEPPAPCDDHTPERLLLCKEGEFWTLAYDGQTCRLKSVRGLDYIADLLQHAGEEVHALELIRRAGGTNGGEHCPTALTEADTLATRRDSDAGEMLDQQAQAAYKRRLRDLEEEREEARAFNDIGRAERARAEIDMLMRELSRAVGLGGRNRRAGSHAERARVNVTRAISLALKKVTSRHPTLGAHLDRTVKTGTFCVYMGGPSLTIGDPD